jgi:hypothetical protein
MVEWMRLGGAAVLVVALGCSDDETTNATSTSGSGAASASNTSASNTSAASTSGSGGSVPGAPMASFTMNPTCTMSSTDPISFTSTSTDPEGDTLTCSWVFSSGTPGTGDMCSVSGVTFPNFAPYTVTLTVSDGTNSDMASMQIGPCP